MYVSARAFLSSINVYTDVKSLLFKYKLQENHFTLCLVWYEELGRIKPIYIKMFGKMDCLKLGSGKAHIHGIGKTLAERWY